MVCHRALSFLCFACPRVKKLDIEIGKEREVLRGTLSEIMWISGDSRVEPRLTATSVVQSPR